MHYELNGDGTTLQGLAFSPEGILHGVAPVSEGGGTYNLFQIDLEVGFPGQLEFFGLGFEMLELEWSLGACNKAFKIDLLELVYGHPAKQKSIINKFIYFW